MSGQYQVQNSIPYYTGIASDVVTNVFNFNWASSGTPSAGDITQVANSVAAFYEAAFLASSTPDMAPYMRPSLCRQKVYNMQDPTPRVPVLDRVTALTVKLGTTGGLPPEVALCASFKATPTSGISLASQRGRIYVGGLGTGCFTAGATTTFPAPTSLFISQLNTAAKALRDVAATTHFQWEIYSKKVGLSFLVASGWVDNAFDTQRRRGQAPTARTSWS